MRFDALIYLKLLIRGCKEINTNGGKREGNTAINSAR